MYRWTAQVGPEHVERVRAAYDDLAVKATGLRNHTHGTDVGTSADAFDFHVVADFDSVADWRRYRDHPAHVLLVQELIVGHVTEQATGQFHTAGHVHVTARHVADDHDESDEALLERARRAAAASMETLLAEPDDV